MKLFSSKKAECTFKPTEIVEQVDGFAFSFRKFRCSRCSYLSVLVPDIGQEFHRDCDRQWGIGDIVGRTLTAVGVTKPRYEIIFGPCHCDERQAYLNQTGWMLSDYWYRVFKIEQVAFGIWLARKRTQEVVAFLRYKLCQLRM